jgi:hypothetical protein
MLVLKGGGVNFPNKTTLKSRLCAIRAGFLILSYFRFHRKYSLKSVQTACQNFNILTYID